MKHRHAAFYSSSTVTFSDSERAPIQITILLQGKQTPTFDRILVLQNWNIVESIRAPAKHISDVQSLPE